MEVKELAALITAVAALIGAVGTIVNTWRVNSVKKEVTNNHGSSMKDAVNRLERDQASQKEVLDLVLTEVRSLGHQIGEVRKDAAIAHEDYASRLRALEQKT